MPIINKVFNVEQMSTINPLSLSNLMKLLLPCNLTNNIKREVKELSKICAKKEHLFKCPAGSDKYPTDPICTATVSYLFRCI